MRLDTFKEMLDGIFGKCKEVNMKKSHDYAGDSDTLQNFKNQCSLRNMLRKANCTPSDVAYDFMLTKIARLGNLRGQTPENETIEDSIVDLINYSVLYYACKTEE